MLLALRQAKYATKVNELPVGAVVVYNNSVISANHNQTKSQCDPTAHAEIICIRESSKILSTDNLSSCEIYVTLEPCAMCAQAIALSKIKRLYFGAYNKKFGAIENGVRLFYSKTQNHVPEIYGGIEQKESLELIKNFFAKIRQKI